MHIDKNVKLSSKFDSSNAGMLQHWKNTIIVICYSYKLKNKNFCYHLNAII